MPQTLPDTLELVAFTASTTRSFPLPVSGTVVIGRDDDNDIALDDPTVSRRHALLHLNPPLRIEDVGSSNGIRLVKQLHGSTGTAKLRESRLAPGESRLLELGEGAILGSTLLVVQLREDGAPPSSKASRTRLPAIVRDPAMQELYGTVGRIAQSQISVLLLGETGVGKEVLAEAIHRRSPRAQNPFLCLNCAALSETLLESELFGHEAGAFTGATRAKPGLLELADGGTVFLDEVGELPSLIQSKILRVLEDRKVLRVGGLRPKRVDVRFIAATNRDLSAEAQDGNFRNDLYFRLNGISLTIPPLRERIVEIEPLARCFISEACVRMRRRGAPRLSPAARGTLEAHPWPGNIRELRNVIERAVVLCQEDTILPAHLQLQQPPPAGGQRVARATTLAPGRLKETPEQERARILEALTKCAGNQSRAAELLGMSRRTLVSRLDAYGITRPRKRS